MTRLLKQIWKHKALPKQEAGLIVVILVMGGAITLFSDRVTYRDAQDGKRYQVNRFLQPKNMDQLIKDTSFFAIMAVGATFIIISGGIDLSVGSVYCLAAISGAIIFNKLGPGGAGLSPGVVVPLGILVCLTVGTLCGLLNGLLIVGLNVHPFIITLGMMAILRGVAFVMTKGLSVTGFPDAFTDGLIRLNVGGFYPVPMAIMLAVTIGGAVLLQKTAAGRHVYAIGGNELAGRFSGVPVNRMKVLIYMLGGLTAGIAAMIYLGYYGSAASNAGYGYELEVIAAAVVGGASLTGGKGTAFGAMLGALLIRMIDNAVVSLQIDQNYSRIIIGAVIIIAVVLDQASGYIRKRKA